MKKGAESKKREREENDQESHLESATMLARIEQDPSTPLADSSCPISRLPVDLLANALNRAQERPFTPHFGAVNHSFRGAYHYALVNRPSQNNQHSLANNNTRAVALAKQQAEIAYLLESKESILEKTAHSNIIESCFRKLAESQLPANNRLNDLVAYHAREEIINQLNAQIIWTRINLNKRQLSCENVHLTRLPSALLNDPSLKTYWSALDWFNLNGNQLTTLPAEIGHLAALSELYLNGNQLTTLPAEIGQLAKLILLKLNGNQLTKLPAEIGQLAKLIWLHLNGNQLTTLPDEIRQLQKLRWLHLDDNQLTTLPAEIGQLALLRELYLYGNQLTTLPAGIEAVLWLCATDGAAVRSTIEEVLGNQRRPEEKSLFSKLSCAQLKP